MLADIALRPWSACTLASILCVACLIQFPDMVVGIQAEQSVLVDELPGRQLLIPGAENIALRQAQTSRNVEYARNRSPYLVRVQHPVGKDLLQSLHDVAGKDIYYAPHDTYIVSMTHEEMGLISQKEGVIGVFLVPTEMKVEYPVLHALRRRRGDIQTSADPVGRLHSTSANNTVTFIIGTSIHVERDPSYRAAFMNSVQADIVSCGVGGEVKLKLESSTKISCEITDETEALWKIVHCIASAWWSVWMTEKPKYHALNYYSNRVAQSGSLQTPIWDAGLRGEGEVIGMADTGLDWDGCFFFDPDEEVAFCLGMSTCPVHVSDVLVSRWLA